MHFRPQSGLPSTSAGKHIQACGSLNRVHCSSVAAPGRGAYRVGVDGVEVSAGSKPQDTVESSEVGGGQCSAAQVLRQRYDGWSHNHKPKLGRGCARLGAAVAAGQNVLSKRFAEGVSVWMMAAHLDAGKASSNRRRLVCLKASSKKQGIE